MLKPGLRAMRGFTLVELMLALGILGILIMLALPSLASWIQNTQLRTAAEGMHAGLTLARAEALRRNAVVRFQIVDTLTSSCGFSATGTNWVISLADATAACEVDPSETTAPQIIQKRSGNEGSSSAQITTTGGNTVQFNGLGRVLQASGTVPAPLTRIDITNPGGGDCKTASGNEPMRCLRITVTSGGQVRMCDPAVDDNTDPRFC
jgi:type IV fimbrial biogenesis protein FimT